MSKCKWNNGTFYPCKESAGNIDVLHGDLVLPGTNGFYKVSFCPFCGEAGTRPEPEITDELAKTRPLCFFSDDNILWSDGIYKLVFVAEGMRYPYYTSIGEQYKYCRLATAEEIQER